jgi:hypothetical protein
MLIYDVRLAVVTVSCATVASVLPLCFNPRRFFSQNGRLRMTQSTPEARATGGNEPRMGVNFPLADFEQRIAADPDVLGMIYTGSLGRGEADCCSDIDLKLWVRDAVLHTPKLLEHYMSWLGELHFVMSFGLWGNGYAGPDWQSIDVGIGGKSDFEPAPYYHRATVVKDTDGWLAALVAASPPPTPALTRESAQKVIEEAIHILGFITMHNIRGSYFHAVANLCEQTGNVYGLLARLRGREPYDVRFAERLLHPDEVALLYAAWPAAPERDAIRRAVRGLWQWTRYAWDEAERMLSASLDIPLDAEAMLAALERPYSWTQAVEQPR